MTYYFAGFSCDYAELKENAAAQKPVNLLFALLALGYAALIIFLSKRYRHFSRGRRIAVRVLMPLAGIVGLAGFFLISFFTMPHWC